MSESNSLADRLAFLNPQDFPDFEKGSIWLVGAGPGAPGLLTLLACHGIRSADVLIHDALVQESVLNMARSGCARIFAGKRGGRPSTGQADICRLMIAEAKKGKRVVRLKGGDPFMFGRGAEECLRLTQAGIRFRIVPGISAGIGGLAYAGIPVTHRTTNHAVVFLTGHDCNGLVPASVDWSGVAGAAPVIVMYMALAHLSEIARRLVEAGRSPQEPVAIVSNATLASQSVVRGVLGKVNELLVDRHVLAPAIVVTGPVVDLGKQIDWFERELRDNHDG